MNRTPLRPAGFAVALALALAVSFPGAAAFASSADSPLDDASPPERVLAAFDERWAATKDYSCRLDTVVRKGDVEERSVLEFQFKAPNLFASRVAEGKDVGAWVWRGRDGRIRAKKEGALSLIKITMEPDDPRLADCRGARLQDADWGSLIAPFKRRAEAGWTFSRPPDEVFLGAECHVVRAEGPPDERGETREEFRFRKGSFAVLSRTLWEGDRVVDDTKYTEIRINRGLSDEDFEK